MAKVLLEGGRVAHASTDSTPKHERRCTCDGENPNCMYCDGLRIVRGRLTSPVPHKTEVQVIRRAIQASKAKTTAAMTLERFEKAFRANLDRLIPAHHCTVRFVEKYPCNRLSAGAIAFRTKYVLERTNGRVVRLTWHNPQHREVVVHRHTPLGVQMMGSQLSFDLAGEVVARSDGAPVVIQPITPKRIQTQPDDAKGKDRYVGKITSGASRTAKERKSPAGRPTMESRESPDTRVQADERALDATRGVHVFREYGSARFGSMPSHDEFDE